MATDGTTPTRIEREVDHHDRIFLDDANQHYDPDNGNHAEIHFEKHQGQERTNAGGRQARENRDGVNEALIENAQHEIDDDDGSKQ